MVVGYFVVGGGDFVVHNYLCYSMVDYYFVEYDHVDVVVVHDYIVVVAFPEVVVTVGFFHLYYLIGGILLLTTD